MRYYSYEDLESFATDDEQKEHLLAMLDAFDAFCSEHGLRYYLSGGTLLGAIRHKGFIPWDDDVDVNMPRPDCEKLMELSGGNIGGYYLQGPNYTDLYHAYHWKLYDDSILVGKRGKHGLGSKIYPTFMDIFPIEGLPDTMDETVRHYDELIKKKDRINLIWKREKYGGRDPLKKAKLYKEKEAAYKVGVEKLFQDVVDYMKSIPFDEADYIGVMSTNVHTVEERMVKKEYLPIIRVDFEGHQYNAPACYDKYLTQLYGKNYMNLLPINEQVSKHGLVTFHAKKLVIPKDVRFDWDAWQKKWCSGKPDVKVAICGLVKSENLGEKFIARSLEYLIGTEARKKRPDLNIAFREVDLLARNDDIEKVPDAYEKKVRNFYGYQWDGIKTDRRFDRLKRIGEAMPEGFMKNSINTVRNEMWKHGENYRKRMQEFFEKRLHGADFIVVDGAGLLEYSYNEYEWSLLLISEYAEKHGIPVVYNAIGRAGAFSEKDNRSKILKRALQSDAVKYISARDSRKTVQICAGDKHHVKLLADAAFWMNETYQIPSCPERKKIGIGLVRGNSLTGYGKDFDNDDWTKLFAGIARQLKKRGYEFEFFTNGLPGDIAQGREVLKELGLPNSYMVTRPEDDLELYSTIERYQALITCRMHSSIAAFTRGIPSVILSWNDKVDKLMKTVGYPERAIPLSDFKPKHIVDMMEKAIAEGVSDEKVGVMKAKAKESVDDYIDLILDAAK